VAETWEEPLTETSTDAGLASGRLTAWVVEVVEDLEGLDSEIRRKLHVPYQNMERVTFSEKREITGKS
jgi:hypothetical protein